MGRRESGAEGAVALAGRWALVRAIATGTYGRRRAGSELDAPEPIVPCLEPLRVAAAASSSATEPHSQPAAGCAVPAPRREPSLLRDAAYAALQRHRPRASAGARGALAVAVRVPVTAAEHAAGAPPGAARRRCAGQ